MGISTADLPGTPCLPAPGLTALRRQHFDGLSTGPQQSAGRNCLASLNHCAILSVSEQQTLRLIMRTKANAIWADMMRRCYDEKSLQRWPTYRGTTVCPEWHDFNVFEKWFDEHYAEGFELDKDLLAEGARCYCPELCVFVPQWLNKFLTSFEQKKGRDLPTGVCRRSTYYRARGRHPFKGEVQIGYFPTIDEAHAAYINHKCSVLDELRPALDKIDTRIYNAILSKLQGTASRNSINIGFTSCLTAPTFS